MSKPNYKHHANNPAKRGWWIRGNNNAKKGQ